ncbi:MAG TPA: NrfD/PsrC family molybdoenzyme membrane anchor subunit [Thermoanaerobaculia bacterium]|nr:NrfD/PsrC family molybdoenzyme membrane anchor subunit [Thermoanaerobaculia bacterium]
MKPTRRQDTGGGSPQEWPAHPPSPALGGSPAGEPPAGDGRNIDPGLGLLAGEGSAQRVGPRQEGQPAGRQAAEPWRELPSRSFGGPEPTYYGRPVLKEPVWIWAVPLYFYAGGAAGAAAVLGGAAQAAGGPAVRGLVARCRWTAALGALAGSALLVHDLGRPERFLNMLRVFRPTSPMSVGSWVLAAFSSLTMGAALLAGRRGGLRKLGNLAGYGGALLGLPLAGYTAVLLANTAVPVWQASRRSLGGLFIGSAASGAASLLGLMPLAAREERIVHRFGVAGKVAELAAMSAVEHEAGRVAEVGRPLRAGLSGGLWQAARLATAASLALSLLPGGSRRRRVAAGLLGTAGAIGLRYAVFHAGKASARDPRATFRQQRAGRDD